MKQRLVLLFCFCAAVLALLPSCSEIRQPTLDATATATALSPGQTAQLTVTRHFEGGPVENVTTKVTYAVTPRDIITVSTSGLVTPATQSGNAEVRVTELDSNAIAILHFTVSSSRLVSIRLDPTPAISLKPGETRHFKATAVLTNGSDTDVSTTVIWTSSNEAAATVGVTQADIGLVTAVAEGETTITATDALSNTQARTLVIVNGDPAVLAAINVTPNPATVAPGAVVPFSALGVFSNGRTSDLTHTVTWSSSDATKATVDANGVAAGIAPGGVTITAGASAASGGPPVKGSTALTVQ